MVMSKVSEITSSIIGDTLSNIKAWGDVFYNAQEHGIFPDGTDVTNKLQALVNLANSQGRTAIFFPHGEYLVTYINNDGNIYYFGDNAKFIGGYNKVIYQIGSAPSSNLMINVKDFGAVGDGITNDLQAVINAVSSLSPYSTLYFPKGTYLLTGSEIPINEEYITIDGTANLIMDVGFRPKKSHFTIKNLTMTCPSYNINAIAVRVYLPTAKVSDFQLLNCKFFNFFYACDFSGGDYTEPNTEILLSDVIVSECYSSTWKDKNAGHFQCINVHNVSYQNNVTYGGQNATSYNAINTNGFLRVVGNYDDYNSYGSCEIENASNQAVVIGNTFGNTLWADDSKNIIFNANVVMGKIFVTVGSDTGNADNIVISNNICQDIIVDSFGEYVGGSVNNLTIVGNTITSNPNDNAWGILINGQYCKTAYLRNNVITGTYANGAIGITRSSDSTIVIESNTVSGIVTVVGTGGKVYKMRNIGATYNGTFDSFPTTWNDEISDGALWTANNGNKYRVLVNDTGGVYTISI